MVKINLFDLFNPTVKQIEINDNCLSKKIYQQAMFDQIIVENAGKRQGTHSTLTKSEVEFVKKEKIHSSWIAKK